MTKVCCASRAEAGKGGNFVTLRKACSTDLSSALSPEGRDNSAEIIEPSRAMATRASAEAVRLAHEQQ